MSNDSGLSNNDSRRFGKGNAAGSAEEGTLQVGAPGTKLRWWYWGKNELNEVLWSWRCSQYHATVMRFESNQNYLCQYRYVYVQLCSPLIHLIE